MSELGSNSFLISLPNRNCGQQEVVSRNRENQVRFGSMRVSSIAEVFSWSGVETSCFKALGMCVLHFADLDCLMWPTELRRGLRRILLGQMRTWGTRYATNSGEKSRYPGVYLSLVSEDAL